MRVTTTLKQPSNGPLSKLIQDDMETRKIAFRNTLRRESRGLEKDIENGLTYGGVPKLAPMMASRTYPQDEQRGSFEAQAVVYVKAGPEWQKVIKAALEGATIRAQGGKYLAIPTAINRPNRQVLGWTPRAMVESGAAFVVRRKNGLGLIWMLRVSAFPIPGRKKGVVVSGALARRATLRAGRVGAVPMFLLIPELTLRARMNFPAAVQARFDLIPSSYVTEYERLSRA